MPILDVAKEQFILMGTGAQSVDLSMSVKAVVACATLAHLWRAIRYGWEERIDGQIGGAGQGRASAVLLTLDAIAPGAVILVLTINAATPATCGAAIEVPCW